MCHCWFTWIAHLIIIIYLCLKYRQISSHNYLIIIIYLGLKYRQISNHNYLIIIIYLGLKCRQISSHNYLIIIIYLGLKCRQISSHNYLVIIIYLGLKCRQISSHNYLVIIIYLGLKFRQFSNHNYLIIIIYLEYSSSNSNPCFMTDITRWTHVWPLYAPCMDRLSLQWKVLVMWGMVYILYRYTAHSNIVPSAFLSIYQRPGNESPSLNNTTYNLLLPGLQNTVKPSFKTNPLLIPPLLSSISLISSLS